MSDFGIQIFTSANKPINIADASPLQFIRKIPSTNLTIGGSPLVFDFSSSVPAGTKIIVWTDLCALVLESNIYLSYLTVPVNITVTDRTVKIWVDNVGGGWFPVSMPDGFWVFAVYGQPQTTDGWGISVADGGAYPYVVNSDAGMFMTQKNTVAFTGAHQLNCSENAIVFCNWNDDSIGIFFDRSAKKITGYKQAGIDWGNPGGFNTTLKYCVFDIVKPTVPEWGLQIFGADGKTSFTSEEIPLIIRQWITLPQTFNSWTNFNSGNMPMIPLMNVGGRITNNSDVWKINLAMNNTHMGYGPGEQIVHIGSDILDNGEEIPYRGKTVPVIWGGDYF